MTRTVRRARRRCSPACRSHERRARGGRHLDRRAGGRRGPAARAAARSRRQCGALVAACSRRSSSATASIAPDLPGHGESAPATPSSTSARLRWLDELIDATCAEPPVVVGHALGGAIAARFAAAPGDAIAQLVLVDALGLAPFAPEPGVRRGAARVPGRSGRRDARRAVGAVRARPRRVARAHGRRWAPFEAYNVDRARTPGVQAALAALMEHFGLPGDPGRRAGADRRAHDADLGPPRPRDAARGRRGGARPLRLAAARDRRTPRTTRRWSARRRSRTRARDGPGGTGAGRGAAPAAGCGRARPHDAGLRRGDAAVERQIADGARRSWSSPAARTTSRTRSSSPARRPARLRCAAAATTSPARRSPAAG